EGRRGSDRRWTTFSRHGDIIIVPDRGRARLAPGDAPFGHREGAVGCPSGALRRHARGVRVRLRWPDAPGNLRPREPRRGGRRPAVAALASFAAEARAGPDR